MEYTAPHTPKQNGKLERSFETLWDKIRAMMNSKDVESDLRDTLWAECAAKATKLNNLIVKKEGKCTH